MVTDIFCVGELVIDFIPGNEKGSYVRNPGGAPANVAVAISKNDHKAGYCGKVGADDFGKFLINVLRDNGVEILCDMFTEKAVTTLVFVNLDNKGERSFTFARKPGADMFLEIKDINIEQLNKTKIVHAGSCSLSEEPASSATKYVLQQGAQLGKLISFDVNYRNLMWKDNIGLAKQKIDEVLPYVDLLKISEEESFVYDGYNSILDFMINNDISIVVETLGGNGARCYFENNVFEVTGMKANVVDTTGAGDAFWGGFLSSLIKENVIEIEDINGDIIRRALNYGNIAGWLCVQKKGAIRSLPNRKEIEKILSERRDHYDV